MPHKRAKASIRKTNSMRMGFDLPPSQQLNHNGKRKSKNHRTSDNQTIPKNMFRILNAEKIRAEYKMRNLGSLESPSSSLPKTTSNKQKTKSPINLADGLKILPGEGLGTFNRRVEEALRPKVTAAMKAARKKQNNASQADPKGKASSTAEGNQDQSKTQSEPQVKPTELKKIVPIKDFMPRPSKFPITDTVMEPPSLRLTKSMKKVDASSSALKKSPLPISSAQKRIMELERNKAIIRYRQMKEERNASN